MRVDIEFREVIQEFVIIIQMKDNIWLKIELAGIEENGKWRK